VEEGLAGTKRRGEDQGAKRVDKVSLLCPRAREMTRGPRIQNTVSGVTASRGQFFSWFGGSPLYRNLTAHHPDRFRRNHGRDRASLWNEDVDHKTGFHRGDKTWWREQYYEYEVRFACASERIIKGERFDLVIALANSTRVEGAVCAAWTM
jgi:hypothetical protein